MKTLLMMLLCSPAAAQCYTNSAGQQICPATTQVMTATPVMSQPQVMTVCASGQCESGMRSRRATRNINRLKKWNRISTGQSYNSLPELSWDVQPTYQMSAPVYQMTTPMATPTPVCIDCQPISQAAPKYAVPAVDPVKSHIFVQRTPDIKEVSTVAIEGPKGERGPRGYPGKDATLNPELMQDLGQQIGSQVYQKVMSQLPEITIEFENDDGTIASETRNLADGNARFVFVYEQATIRNK